MQLFLFLSAKYHVLKILISSEQYSKTLCTKKPICNQPFPFSFFPTHTCTSIPHFASCSTVSSEDIILISTQIYCLYSAQGQSSSVNAKVKNKSRRSMKPLISGGHQPIYLVHVVLIHVMKFQAVGCSWGRQQRREGTATDI